MNCLGIRDIFLHRPLFSETLLVRGHYQRQCRSLLQHLQLVCGSLPSVIYLITLLHWEHLDDLLMEENPISCLEKLLGCFVQFALLVILLHCEALCECEQRVQPCAQFIPLLLSAVTSAVITGDLAPGSHTCPYHHAASTIVSVTSGLQLAVNFMKLFPACRLWRWHANLFQSVLGLVTFCDVCVWKL